MVLFLSGFAVPIRFFPDWAQPTLLALPFSAMVQVPSDVFLGRLSGADLLIALARQAAWVVALLFTAQAVVSLAMRRVSIQGG
jgi:ABC-2 type transport system permease protein